MKVHEKIKAEIERRGLTVTDAAPILGIVRPNLSKVINGSASLSIQLALALERKFGMNARALLVEQLDQDIKATRTFTPTRAGPC